MKEEKPDHINLDIIMKFLDNLEFSNVEDKMSPIRSTFYLSKSKAEEIIEYWEKDKES